MAAPKSPQAKAGPKITFVRFRDRQPRPKSRSKAYGHAAELKLEDCPGGFRAGPIGISYKHQMHGIIEVPWTGVVHVHREDPRPAKSKAQAPGKGAAEPVTATT